MIYNRQADGVGDKVKEIQTALADAQATGSEVKIEGSTFSNLATLITESQTALKSTTTDAVNFAEALETAADQQEIINTQYHKDQPQLLKLKLIYKISWQIQQV